MAALELLGFLAMNVHCNEHGYPARLRQHHGEVLIIQATVGAVFDWEHIRAHAADRLGQRYREALDEGRVVAFTGRGYGGRGGGRRFLPLSRCPAPILTYW